MWLPKKTWCSMAMPPCQAVKITDEQLRSKTHCTDPNAMFLSWSSQQKQGTCWRVLVVFMLLAFIICKLNTELLWRFPEMAVPPFIIHFSRIFHKINPPAIGVSPMTMENPIWLSGKVTPLIGGQSTPSCLAEFPMIGKKKGLTNKLGLNQRCKKWDLSS